MDTSSRHGTVRTYRRRAAPLGGQWHFEFPPRCAARLLAAGMAFSGLARTSITDCIFRWHAFCLAKDATVFAVTPVAPSRLRGEGFN